MEFVRIKDINKYKSQSIDPSKSPEQIYEVYSVPSFETKTPEYLKGADIGSTKVMVEKDDVLLCKINPRINRVWIVGEPCEYPSIASSEWIIIRAQGVLPRYLAWYFRSPKFQTMMTSEVTGIGGSLTRAQPKRVAEYSVPLVPYDEQVHIAQIFDSLQSAISSRLQQLAELDNLVKAQFIEMFGTIHNNRFDYAVCTLQDVCEPIRDGTHQTPEYIDDTQTGYKFLSSKDVTSGKIGWNHLKYIPEHLHQELYARIAPRKGDVLLAKNGTTGIAAVVDRDEVFDIYVSLALLRPIEMDSTYLWAAINSAETKRQFDGSLKGIGVPNLHLSEIRKALILHPPTEKQKEFAAFVAQIDKSKVAVQAALDEAQTLFDSLMQKYFG